MKDAEALVLRPIISFITFHNFLLSCWALSILCRYNSLFFSLFTFVTRFRILQYALLSLTEPEAIKHLFSSFLCFIKFFNSSSIQGAPLGLTVNFLSGACLFTMGTNKSIKIFNDFSASGSTQTLDH